MKGLLSNRITKGLVEENNRLRAERSEFLWTLAWAEVLASDYLRDSANAKRLHGDICDLLGKSAEGRYVLNCVKDPRNRPVGVEAA
jgi:hypothetical protein